MCIGVLRMDRINLMQLCGFVLQLSSIGVENVEGARRNLRELLFTSPNVSDYISGVVRGTNYYEWMRFYAWIDGCDWCL